MRINSLASFAVLMAAADSSKGGGAGDGYQALDLDMPAVRWEDTASIEGTILDTDIFHSDNGDKRVFVVNLGGVPHRLIEQPGLRRLFEKCAIGDSIKVTATGFRDLGDKMKMRTFEAAIKPGSGQALGAKSAGIAEEQIRARPSRSRR